MRPTLSKKAFDKSHILSAEIAVVSTVDVQLTNFAATIGDIINEIDFTTQQTDGNVRTDSHQLSRQRLLKPMLFLEIDKNLLRKRACPKFFETNIQIDDLDFIG